MHISFLCALAAVVWAVVMPMLAIQALAVALTAWWAMHLMVYAFRAAKRPGPPSARPDAPRRQFAATFAKTFLLVAVATALPTQRVWAGNCDCPSNMKCCWNYAGDFAVCAPLDANCCAHANKPWYCSQGQNCYGDSSCR
jgi:hypothetical protein